MAGRAGFRPPASRRRVLRNCPAGPGNTQAIAGHHFTPGYTPAGSAQQNDINNNNLFLPLSCSGDNSTTHIAYGEWLEYSCSDDDDGWSTVDGQYTDQTPQSVAIQPDEQCDTMSHSERIILAHTFLCDELPATESLVPRTVPRLSALADNTVPVAPQPGFPFSEETINHFQKIQQELLTTTGGKSHRFASVPRFREAMYSPLELSSTGFLFSRDSPVRKEETHSRSIHGLIDHVDIGSVSTEQLLEQLKATLQLSQSVATAWYDGATFDCATASTGPSSMRSLSPCATRGTGAPSHCSI